MTDPSPTIVPTRDGYDRWSEVYDADGNPLVCLEGRVAPGLLGEVRGLRVADIGCGTGRHALRLAREGAFVTGVDFSEGMLAAARAKPGASGVRWVGHDLARELPFPDASFDRVICALVLDHIEPVAAFLGELARVCTPEGFVLATVMHPAMMLRGVQARFTDPSSGRRVMPRSVPNSVADYVMGAESAGLWPVHMSEHAVDEALVRAAPRAGAHPMGWPMLLVFKWRRGSGGAR